jgi:hypothetical protein
MTKEKKLLSCKREMKFGDVQNISEKRKIRKHTT